MKYLVLISLLVCSSFSYASAKRLKGWANYTCFEYRHQIKADHAWEVSGIVKTMPWVLIDQDLTAVFIAQPSSYCSENDLTVSQCPYYWFRTVRFNDDWMEHQGTPAPIPCPAKLQRKELMKLKKGLNY